VLCGRLAVGPELRRLDSGATMMRLLVTVRSDDSPRRIDVLPVTIWDPELFDETWQSGDRVWVSGSVRRLFSDAPEGRRSRLEVVASHVVRADVPIAAACGT